MNRHDDRLQLLDPVDRAHTGGDHDELLARILREPVPAPAPAPRRRVPRPARVAVAAAGAAAVAVAAGVPRGDDVDVLAAAQRTVSEPGTILHYVVAGPAGTEVEVWQAADGARQRTVTRADGSGDTRLGETESVVDGRRSETYVADMDAVIVYDERPVDPAPPGGVGAPAVGDPRRLLERAAAGDAAVDALGEGTVRGIDVLRFRVDGCAVVSIAQDEHVPVRLEQPDCRPDGTVVSEGMVFDYPIFEVLAGGEADRDLLELRPHPGARVLDGEDLDAAEERSAPGG